MRRSSLSPVLPGIDRGVSPDLSDDDVERFTLHFSNERTFLAWIRTAITLMGFGYAIARFALYLDEDRGRGATIYFGGLAMTFAGLVALALSARRYRASSRRIDRGISPRTHEGYVYAFATLVGVTGLALAGLLLSGGW